MSTIPSWAVRGAKVVCVDDKWPDGTWYGDEEIPANGVVYTVRAVKQHSSGAYGLLLVEIRNDEREYDDGVREALFQIKRFRPLITRTQEQDVAKFKHLLNSTPADLERVQ